MALIGYARVSTGDQHAEAQIDKLRAHGYETVFTDRGVSGSLAHRPQWDLCLDRLQAGDKLGVVKLDRIGRSADNLLAVLRVLRDRDVSLAVLDQGIDTSGPFGKMVFTVVAAIAEFERDLIIERTRDGQLAVRRRGNMRRTLGGRPPLGFRDTGGDDWEIDQEAAAWLQDAASRVLAGEPVDAVHADMPAITDASGREVTAKMLRAALIRPASAGLIVIDGVTLGPAAVGGPLDEDTSRRLGLMFAARKRGRPAEPGRFPLGPLLRCGKCGNQLTGDTVRNRRSGEKREYYACKNPHKALGVPRPCMGCSVPADDLHELVACFLEAWGKSPAVRAAQAQAQAQMAEPMWEERAKLNETISRAQAQMADMADKLLRKYVTEARFEKHEAEAMRQIDTATADLDLLDKMAAAAKAAPPPSVPWDKLTDEEKRQAVELAAETPIVVQPGNGGGAARSASERVRLVPRQG